MNIKINELMEESGVQFGTSGVRGLVKDMTDQVCFSYVTAFLQYLHEKHLISTNGKMGIAGDLRNSSPRIMNAAAAACVEMGFEPVNYGHIPSPAIALFGLKEKIPTIMVTGSHIPDDRNGIKFNTPLGEILKPDEEGIRAQEVSLSTKLFTANGELNKPNYLPISLEDANNYYIQRFIDFLPENCLAGKHIGLYEHSSVSRDCFKVILEQLGASVISLGRSDVFISVDTEAIRPEDVKLARQWSKEHNFDCIISTDGDGDRPLISDEYGNWLRGDVAGILCAQYLQADTAITPVSSNSALEKSVLFNNTIRTKIGSPYVIEAMQQAEKIDEKRRVIGYEANGGFLQQTTILMNNKVLSSLPTRDAVIVPLAIILLAKLNELSISELVKTLPQRYTYSDRLKNIPTVTSKKILSNMVMGDLATNITTIKVFFPQLGEPISIDETDGVRITFNNDDVVHFRPSGNAPELRCYTETESEMSSQELNEQCINAIKMRI